MHLHTVRSHRVELSEETEHPLHAAEARSLAGRGRVVAVLDGLGGRVEAGQALTLLQHALVSRLEEAVGHLLGFGQGRECMDDIEERVSTRIPWRDGFRFKFKELMCVPLTSYL